MDGFEHRGNFSETGRAILAAAIPLFAEKGFAAVTVREIAESVGIRTATLYYHFPSKDGMYIAAIAQTFADKAEGITSALAEPGTPDEKLRRLIFRFTERMAGDRYFRLLLQRELLDGDEKRLRLLAETVFREQFSSIAGLAADVSPGCDAHLLAISMAGLVLYHLETAPIRRFLPGGRPEHDDPAVIAQHVTRLLLQGIGGCGSA
ncbi:MAG: TetR/AcrR family transcriptional regulator [Magnetococcus sp. YQC-5]